MEFTRDVVVVGGCGHVGLPLGLALANAGLRVALFDTNADTVDIVSAGKMPFLENGADEVLSAVTGTEFLTATTEPAVVGTAEHVVIVIGTPVDSHLNPNPRAVPAAIEDFIETVRARGTRLVLVTHDIGQARRLADTVLFMHHGRIVERAPSAEFFEAPRQESAQAFIEGRIVL